MLEEDTDAAGVGKTLWFYKVLSGDETFGVVLFAKLEALTHQGSPAGLGS